MRLDLQQLKKSFEEQYELTGVDIIAKKNNHMFYVEHVAQKQSYILKFFDQTESLSWQANGTDRLIQKGAIGIVPFLRNAYGQFVNRYGQRVYGVMPYIRGRTIEPQNRDEVLNGMQLLGHFHQKARGIVGRNQSKPHHSLWFERLKKRVQFFQKSLKNHQTLTQEGVLSIIQHLAQEAITWSEWVLQHTPQQTLYELEIQALEEKKVAHLDVAPHNFMRSHNQQYYLIDYDLMQYAPAIIDIVQYINRMLIYHGWSIDVVDELLHVYQRERPLTEQEKMLIWIMLVYPHDFFREWLGVWKAKFPYHPKKVMSYFESVQCTWEERRQFVRACQAVIQ